MHITFIQAGGTIDKDYPRGEMHHGYDFSITHPAVQTILPASHPLFTYDVVETVKKDSLDLTDKDREKILAAIKKSTSDRLIVTHGTDTIFKTAKFLHEKLTDKTVVLTGAMLPERFVNSDAGFNVGMASAAAQTLPPNVYIALYGRVVPWQEFKELHEEHERHARAIFKQGKKAVS
jgi:L-asparaginase